MPRYVKDTDAIPERRGINPFTRQPVVFPGTPSKRLLFECEVDGTTVRIARGTDADDPSTIKTTTKVFDTDDAALFFAWKETHRVLRKSYRAVGRSKVLDTSTAPSWLVVEDLFESASDAFLENLLRFDDEARLSKFAARWLADERPWARQQLLAYIDDGCDRWGHRGLVKHLFQGAEGASDDQLMGRFLVAFDRFIVRIFNGKRRPAMRANGSRKARPARLGIFRDPFVRVTATSRVDPATKKKKSRPERFANATRRYLMRRAWRYFRVLGHRDPKRYGTAIRAALAHYEDASLRTPLRFLDAWGLLHALYHASDVLDWGARSIDVVPGRTLDELVPSLRYPAAWENAFHELVPMLADARSRPVRVVVAKLLEDRHAADLAKLGVRQLTVLLESPNDEARALGTRLLKRAGGASDLTVDDWLRLLEVDSTDVVAAVADAIRMHLDPARLSLAQTIDLAMAGVAPVAELGADWLDRRSVDGADVPTWLRLRDAPIASVRQRALAKVSAALARDDARVEWVRDLLDARLVDARRVGLALLRDVPRWRDEPSLFLALVESPFGDVQAFAVAEAERWMARAPNERSLAGSGGEGRSLRALWATLVLSVHRGSRAKLTALRQIVAALDRATGDKADANADDLVPLLAVALRSVRGPEKIAALSALAGASVRNPAVRRAVASAAPELQLGEVASQ